MNHRQQLCKTIEAALHQEIRTPKDFDQLRERIFLRLHQHVLATLLPHLDDEETEWLRKYVASQFLGCFFYNFLAYSFG